MNLQQITIQYTPNDQFHQASLTSYENKVKEGLKSAGTFIYETPLWVVASAVAGIALLIFYPEWSAPFLGIAGAAVIARLVVKIVEVYYPKEVMVFREKMYTFQNNHPYIQYLAFATSMAVTAFCPIGGAAISSVVGLYKGMVVEIDIFKYKQVIKKEELNNPVISSNDYIVEN